MCEETHEADGPACNERFCGDVIVAWHGKEYPVGAAKFECVEEGNRDLGDGDTQREELWVAPLREDADDPNSQFGQVHVNIVAMNDGPHQFYGHATVFGAARFEAKVDDSALEFHPHDDEDEGDDAEDESGCTDDDEA
jgi:hypothetical protein